MVTLQILVLSFLVRIQVAQLKRLSFEGRFFVVCTMARDVRSNILRCWVSATMQASAPTQHRMGQAHSRHVIPPLQLLCRLILTLCWLSRYDRGLLLDLSVCAFFCKVSALFCKQNSNPGSPTKTTLIRGSFFCYYVVCMRWRAATAVMLFVCRCKHHANPLLHMQSPNPGSPYIHMKRDPIF